MKSNCCPLCGSSDELSAFYVIRIVLHGWPIVLAAAGIVMAAGQLLQTGFWPSLWFAAAAALPFLFRLVRKQECSRCHIEYEVPEEETISIS